MKVFDSLKKEGFVRVRVNGETIELTDEIELDKNKKHSIEVVVDRLVVRPDVEGRLADSLETALRILQHPSSALACYCCYKVYVETEPVLPASFFLH